jgi:long-chain fatty acid transport protein
MALLTKTEFMTGVTLVYPEISFEPGRSTTFDGAALAGGDGGNAGTPALVPNTHFVMPLGKDFVAGFSITSQYGLITDYNPSFVDRYDFINANLFSVNFNPSLAWKATDTLSVGGGLNVAYGRQKLRQAIDFGSVCAAGLGRATCSAGFGLAPGQSDGLARVRQDDWGTGFNLGVIYEPSADTAIGVSYRSKITFDGRGHARFDVPANAGAFLNAAGASAAFANSDAGGRFYFPATGNLAISHQASNRLALMAGVTWTDWSVVEEYRVTFDNPAAADSVIRVDYKDAFRFAAGAEYAFTDTLTLRGGLAFQQAPIRDSKREPAVPDSDRIILAVGASYDLTRRIALDVGYQYHRLTDGSLERVSVTGSTARGTYEISAHFLAMGVRVQF